MPNDNGIEKLSVSSPGKIIITGEHIVVYERDLEDKPYMGITTSIGKESTVNFESLKTGKTSIYSSGLNAVRTLDDEEIKRVYKSFEDTFRLIEAPGRPEDPKLALHSSLERVKALSCLRHTSEYYILEAFIYPIGHYMKKYNNYTPTRIDISTELTKGLGRSASISAAVAGAAHVFYKKEEPITKITDVQKNSFVKVAKDTDNICHGGISSGIDPSTSVFGGIKSYSRIKGLENIECDLSDCYMLIIDSGQESDTAKATEHVSTLYVQNTNDTQKICTDINKISYDTLSCLKKGDIVSVGSNMHEAHKLLGKLGISTEKIDKIVEKVMENDNVYGAKLTGAGMGGSVIAISDSEKVLEEIGMSFREKELDAYVTEIATEGTRILELKT